MNPRNFIGKHFVQLNVDQMQKVVKFLLDALDPTAENFLKEKRASLKNRNFTTVRAPAPSA